MRNLLFLLMFSWISAPSGWSQCSDLVAFRNQLPNWAQSTTVLDLIPQVGSFYVDVTIDAGEGGSLETTSYRILCGSPLTLTANPDACFRFAAWDGDLTATENPLMIPSVQESLHLTAHFEQDAIDVTVNATHGGTTDMDGHHPLSCGETLTIWANANTASEFTGWSGDASGSDNPLVLNDITQSLQITAEYTLKAGVELSGSNLSGQITGLDQPETAKVVLEGDQDVRTTVPTADGSFSFDAVPDGAYFLKVEADGYEGSAKHLLVAAEQAAKTGLNFAMTPINETGFSYAWQDDDSTSGTRATTVVDEQETIPFLDETLVLPNQDFAEKLAHDYNIILSDQETPWSGDQAYRLLEIMKTIPQVKRYSYSEQTLKPSKWLLTAGALANDIQITRATAGDTVRISSRLFANPDPRIVELEGIRDRYFSRRLHHALVRFVTAEGTNATAVRKILTERYGVSLVVPNYTTLTAQTTGENSSHFQAFQPSELVAIINWFEEMPIGLQVATGLEYLVRRVSGQTHPTQGTMAVVGWPNHGYLEFMDAAFQEDPAATHRLILHEKAHFLWENLFSSAIQDAWTELGGWQQAAARPSSWSATSTLFSAYAHPATPGEDLAEALTQFVVDPAALRAQSPEKYTFLLNRIMRGSLYLSGLGAQNTFEVLNLHPNQDFPGKIAHVRVRVEGEPNQDKLVTVEVVLRADMIFQGAHHGFMRIFSSIGTYADLYVYPTNPSNMVLRGTMTISKYAKSGFWRPDTITITDLEGYTRLEGNNDFGWRMYIRNPLEDMEAPTYVADSLSVTTTPETHPSGHVYTMIDISWQIADNRPFENVAVHARSSHTDGIHGLGDWGTFDANTGIAHVRLPVTEYMPSGSYGVHTLSMRDGAFNWGGQQFSNTSPEPMTSVEINTANPDTQAPELDLDSIAITATPTHPHSPTGETYVNIVFYVRDDKSGLGQTWYRLQDPLGNVQFSWYYHENFYTMYFDGDATAWRRYEIDTLLPAGSPPGTWLLKELGLRDKVGNENNTDFTTAQFEVTNAQPLTEAEIQRQPQSMPAPADRDPSALPMPPIHD